MARYEHLPTYKKAMELSIYLQNTVKNFSRYNKYSVGADLRELSRSIILLIIRANSATLTSQFLANIYFNELDQFVKHALKCRYYLRYVDDMILVSAKRDELDSWKREIQGFLANRLALEIKSGSKVRRVSDGADFLGYIVRSNYMLARRRAVNNLKYKLSVLREKMVGTFHYGSMNVTRLMMEPSAVVELRQTLASYMGHFRHADTFNLINSIISQNDWLLEYFVFHKGRLIERFSRKEAFRSMKSQIDFFRNRLKKAILFVKVGGHT